VKPYYEHAGITIYCGDARDIVSQIDGEAIIMENFANLGNWFPIPEKPVSYVSIDYLCKLFIATSRGGCLWKKTSGLKPERRGSRIEFCY
jgi:hypothetical protein